MTDRLTLLHGVDATLVADAMRSVIDAAVGDAERSEVLEDFRGEDYQPSEAALAVETISMFGDRVVVARDLQRFSVADLTPLVDAIGALPDDVTLILAWEGKGTGGSKSTDPLKVLKEAVTAAGGTVRACDPPGGKAASGWLGEQFDRAEVQLSRRAQQLITDQVGEDVGRVRQVVQQLVAVFGAGAGPLDADDVEPFLGDAGGVPPWDLTDAIDRSDLAGAVTCVRRMIGGGGRHPLQVMMSLQTHVERMARLDGSGIADERAAAALLGMKGSTFPAKKALAASKRLGPAGIRRAMRLLATADVELRGRTAQYPEAVMELLVARLAAPRR